MPKTLDRFFADVPSVTILRCELDRLSAFKRVLWEGDEESKWYNVSSDAVNLCIECLPSSEFPHLHAHLEGENVDSFKYVHKEGKSWISALEQPEIQSWLI